MTKLTTPATLSRQARSVLHPPMSASEAVADRFCPPAVSVRMASRRVALDAKWPRRDQLALAPNTSRRLGSTAGIRERRRRKMLAIADRLLGSLDRSLRGAGLTAFIWRWSSPDP
jgi:hypothetical protein